MRALFSALILCCTAVQAGAQEAGVTQLGRPVDGITLRHVPDGGVRLQLAPTIRLEGGRELRRTEGDHYELVEPEGHPPPAATLRGLDFLVSGRDHIGRRVKVTGGRVFGALATRALLSVQGGTVGLDLTDSAREQIVYLVEQCSGISTNDGNCGVDITGTVGRPDFSDTLRLTSIEFERRQAPPRRR